MNAAEGSLILETRGLRKSFGGVHAIDGVDFQLHRGELRCLIGPNGAGKSTFFKMLTGQYVPSAGSILFEGADIAGIAAHAIGRQGIGIKNQVPDVFDGMTGRENLYLAARFAHDRRRANELVEETVARLKVGNFADVLVGELAHGQRQWIEIGMVMARDPKLVLLDEPSAGMSAEETQRTADLIREINRTATVIVVEHDMQFIRQIAKMVTVFHQGRILVQESVEKALSDPRVRDVYLGRHVA